MDMFEYRRNRVCMCRRRSTLNLIRMRGFLLLVSLPLAKADVYLYNTDDGSSVEFYDCVSDKSLSYCRRPLEPISLKRNDHRQHCYHNGTPHLFPSLVSNNISVNTVLHQWKSSIKKAEEYSRYREQSQLEESIRNNINYLCECTHPQSFGKNCEYLLPVGPTLEATLRWQVEMRTDDPSEMQRFGDIVCYATLTCNYGLLCLDWRDICDGVQNCMTGVDEENCDKLEFNECEDDEYRCLNGMCIPEEYFLDGDYDCMDLSDERQQLNDNTCAFQKVNYECDDRMCPQYGWSCGDGQCLIRRLDFQSSFGKLLQCESRREQYHMCEMHGRISQWTLPNGKCYHSNPNETTSITNRTDFEECIYFTKCALSQGADENCPCKYNPGCTKYLQAPCTSSRIRYPRGAVIAPYIFTFYYVAREWINNAPDLLIFSGTVKCRGYMLEHTVQLEDFFLDNIHQMVTSLCASPSDVRVFSDTGYDQHCHNQSRTFNNRSYHFIDVCTQSKECISAYRIQDGIASCEDAKDERQGDIVTKACSNVHRHRFRCSNEQPSCLLVTRIGDRYSDCKNNYDERLTGTETMLSELLCNTQSTRGCQQIRQYIEASTQSATNSSSHVQQQPTRIPFYSFCDTFFNTGSKKDEDTSNCQKGWKCRDTEWQCRSGQCIPGKWVLDGEWDCSDASDEQALFASENAISAHNSKVVSTYLLHESFNKLYSHQPFCRICNLTTEYPCFRTDAPDPLDVERYRPCIDLHKIGDGHVDCVGALDERNNIERCAVPEMLGNYFLCPDKTHCASYEHGCYFPCNDSRIQCVGKRKDGCMGVNDFLCLNGSCATGAWCNQENDCYHGEDEYMCVKQGSGQKLSYEIYREGKEKYSRVMKKELQLPQTPSETDRPETILTAHSMPRASSSLEQVSSSIAYWCNRGVGVLFHNRSIVCLCPPQYYGEKCQFHSDRITVLFQLDLSQSIYMESNAPPKVLKILVIFLHENQPLMTEYFDTRSTLEASLHKKMYQFLYPRSNQSVQHKRDRYMNRSSIENHHPYAVRIEAYELNKHEKSRLVGVWLYPVYFDFLPAFRLAKILRLTKSEVGGNPCTSNPCGRYQNCHRVLNENSTYMCLCPSHFKGNDCSIIDDMCQANFCSQNALCKPNYRGLLNGNERPLCICPPEQSGDRCDLLHDRYFLNSCQNNGLLLSSSKLNEFSCSCTNEYYGKQCELEKQAVLLTINSQIEHDAALVQYFHINFYSLDLMVAHQRVYEKLPHFIKYRHEEETVPEIIVVKVYSDSESVIYLISLHLNVTSVNKTTGMTERNRCLHIHHLPSTRKGRTDRLENVSVDFVQGFPHSNIIVFASMMPISCALWTIRICASVIRITLVWNVLITITRLINVLIVCRMVNASEEICR